VSWARLRARGASAAGAERAATPVRTTPIALLLRRHAPLWRALSAGGEAVRPTGGAGVVAAFIAEQGASFFDDIVAGAGLLRAQVEEALGELAALGLVTSDSFAGLRALLVPSARRKTSPGVRRRRSTVAYGMEGAGRWALLRAGKSGREASAEAVEHVARTLLRRYGVVFWRALEREAGWLPPWRDLLRVFRRLEARGEIRGGRFVAGFSGEQYALPEAIGLLRETRRTDGADEWVSISGADPLNLSGILTPGARLPALAGNRLLYRNGLPVASLAGGDVRIHETLDDETDWRVRKALARGAPSRAPADLAAE
jgi:ATP-dependent Lhr-like helicase